MDSDGKLLRASADRPVRTLARSGEIELVADDSGLLGHHECRVLSIDSGGTFSSVTVPVSAVTVGIEQF